MRSQAVFGLSVIVGVAIYGCNRATEDGAVASNGLPAVQTTTGAEAVPSLPGPAAPVTTEPDSTSIAEGSTAPDFTVQIAGKPVKLSRLKGHPVMLDFWATWCGPCVASLPHTQKIYDQGKAAGLQVIAISGEDNDTVSKFIKDNNYTFPVGLDTNDEANGAYKIEGIPTTVVIDKNGKIVADILGGGQDEAINGALAKVGVKVE